jgi:hypothetical protein
MEYVMARNLTIGSTSEDGALCGSAPIATSCNNRGIVGSCVLCWARSEAISRVESAASSWEADPRRS